MNTILLMKLGAVCLLCNIGITCAKVIDVPIVMHGEFEKVLQNWPSANVAIREDEEK